MTRSTSGPPGLVTTTARIGAVLSLRYQVGESVARVAMALASSVGSRKSRSR